MINLLACFPLLLTVGLVLLGFVIRRPARRLWLIVSLVSLACLLADAVLLAALPRLGLSFGPVARPLLLVNATRLAVLIAGLLFLLALGARLKWTRLVAINLVLIQVILLVLEFDGLYIEPFRLTVTEVRQEAPAFLPDRPLRILQISDLHVERTTVRERAVLREVNDLQPDIIVLTGDYVNQDYLQDPQAWQDARDIVSQLYAPYGVYAVSGTTDVSPIMAEVFNGLDNVRVLDNEVKPISFPGGMLYLVGVSINGDINIDRTMLTSLLAEFPLDGYYVLLYHTPDLIGAASDLGIPLFFAGHTHGGQIRLPFYGALITFSDYGKQYEMGRYQVGPTTLYVSRGLGMEGLDMPRMRFLCPPEIVLFELGE
jgi:predicted MPP superfamily phosphohydrolase